jgi:hypothetical protein
MLYKTVLNVSLQCMLLSSLDYANNCPKWFPMIHEDIIVIIPIYNPNITATDFDCDELIDSVDHDIDGDGVSNTTEIANGTNPFNPDTDGDSVWDTFDVFPLDPTESSDSDGDGIGDNTDLPVISTLSPADDTLFASATDNLSITYAKFDTAISKVSGKYFKVFKANGVEQTNFDVSVAQVGISGYTVTVSPNTHLVYGASHYIKIDSGAFIDTHNEENPGITTSTRWNFSVPSGSGSCECDDFDNCDLPMALQ